MALGAYHDCTRADKHASLPLDPPIRKHMNRIAACAPATGAATDEHARIGCTSSLRGASLRLLIYPASNQEGAQDRGCGGNQAVQKDGGEILRAFLMRLKKNEKTMLEGALSLSFAENFDVIIFNIFLSFKITKRIFLLFACKHLQFNCFL